MTGPVGSELYLVLEANGVRITVKAPGQPASADASYTFDQPVWFRFDPDRVYFFDADRGDAL